MSKSDRLAGAVALPVLAAFGGLFVLTRLAVRAVLRLCGQQMIWPPALVDDKPERPGYTKSGRSRSEL
ncbi:hypothetical protein [Occallatibacter savannae]|uniref:hypothetical protein n=1 Tax=Occallatibacter savannae TaxID=1002691 RepID=UPI000D6A0233|nr:hypothetical protein [Occallatibacter savannae]